MNEFDIKAAGWDQNPIIWERAEAIANDIKRLLPLNKQMTALEFGAGTGVTSFILKDSLKKITLMDNSSEMVKVMNNKIKTSKVKNLKTLNFNLEKDDFKDAKYDLIFNQMVLHHISDIEKIIAKFYNLLNPGGYLAIADLYSEDGSFHGEGFTGQKGFDPIELSSLLLKPGFENISHQKCFVINKEISDTETKQFDVFLLIANRP
ncbi:MAG: class I SAM-dependent methyltransferase [Bacteroidia bacterium]|nr:class I SAM-dependent methyltransferase [Bacteroidia bacterium]